MTMRYANYITRAMVRAEPKTLFVFGDNMARIGFGGQAKEMRGEINTVGIPTKWKPSHAESSYLRDDDFERVRPEIDAAFVRLTLHLVIGGDIVWPTAGIGTGLAELPERAPLIWNYIEAERIGLEKLAAEMSLPSQQESAGPASSQPR